MQAKWYLSTFFLISLFFGVFQEQVSTPNQEIILEFVDAKINQKEIETTIAQVKQKLLKVGVANIQISETQNGNLKISYYSNIDKASIKKELANKHTLDLNKSSNPKEKNKKTFNYNISIHELSNETDVLNSDFKYIFEVKNQSDRFTTYNYDACLKNTEDFKAKQLFRTSYKVSKNASFTKNRTLYTAIEVRAGPKRIFS